MLNCKECSKEFEPKQEYCSTSCRVKNFRKGSKKPDIQGLRDMIKGIESRPVNGYVAPQTGYVTPQNTTYEEDVILVEE